MMTQAHVKEGYCDMNSTVAKRDIHKLEEAMKKSQSNLNYTDLIIDQNIAKITLVGLGLKTNLSIPTTMCKTLADEKINLHMIYSSEIKMSVVIHQNALKQSLEALHKAFELENSPDKEAA